MKKQELYKVFIKGKEVYDTPLPGKQKTILLPLIISLALAKSHSGSFFFAATGDFAFTVNPLAITSCNYTSIISVYIAKVNKMLRYIFRSVFAISLYMLTLLYNTNETNAPI